MASERLQLCLGPQWFFLSTKRLMVRVPLRCDVTHHKQFQVSFVFNGYICFFPTEKGHCLTLSYKPVPPLSLKKRSKFFNQKKCILMRYFSKLDIFIEFFIYGGPLVPLLHTVKQTPSWIKTCSLCEIVLIVLVHYLKPSTALYFCHGVFTDKSTFSLNLPRTKTPHERTSTNQD